MYAFDWLKACGHWCLIRVWNSHTLPFLVSIGARKEWLVYRIEYSIFVIKNYLQWFRDIIHEIRNGWYHVDNRGLANEVLLHVEGTELRGELRRGCGRGWVCTAVTDGWMDSYLPQMRVFAVLMVRYDHYLHQGKTNPSCLKFNGRNVND